MSVAKKILTNIRYKFSLIFVLLIVIFALLCSGIYVSNFSIQSMNNYHNSSYAILSGINNRFEDYIQQMGVYAAFILYPDMSDKKTKEMSDIMERIEFVQNDNENIESIFYYDSQENDLTVMSKKGNGVYKDYEEVKNTSWYRSGVMAGSEMYIQPQHKHVLMGKLKEVDTNVDVFSFIKSYTNETGGKTVLCINVYEKYMRDICANSLTQPTEELYCLNKYGEVIYSTASELSLYDRNYVYEFISNVEEREGHFNFTGPKDKKQKTVVYVMAEDGSNMIYKCVEKKELNADMLQGLQMLFVLLFVIIVITLGVVLYLVRSFTTPIKNLKQCLDEFSLGNLDVRIELAREDEFKDISRSFNDMAYKINQLIKEKYELELYNREAQLYSLMAQVNPHFINNVLQSIGSVALERGMKDIYKSLSTLAKMLRYSIKEESVVTLKKEVENLKEYIYIQKFRFEDKLAVHMNVQEGLDDFLIPKLTLQPLVENSIVHGFKDKREPGILSIDISQNETKVLDVFIRDNGCGIPEDILGEIEKEIRSANYKIEKKHIGIYNVSGRLKYLYAENFHIQIDSIVGQGTVIEFWISREND